MNLYENFNKKHEIILKQQIQQYRFYKANFLKFF